MVNNPDTHVKNNSSKSGNANRGSQGTKIHNDKPKKKTENRQTTNVANIYSKSAPKFQVAGDFTDKITVRGTTLLTDIYCPKHMADLSVVDIIPITPSSIPSTRLSLLAKMYYNYVFKKIKLVYRTRQPNTRDGQVGIYFADDPGELLMSNARYGYLLEAMILEGQQGNLEPVYSNFTINYRGKPFRSAYRANAQSGEIEECVQTNIVVAAQTPTGFDGLTPLGLLEIEYEIELSKPRSILPNQVSQERPNYLFSVGTGAAGSAQTNSTASWDTSVNPWFNDFQQYNGVYLVTICEGLNGFTGLNNWMTIPDCGISLFLKAEYIPNLAVVRFSMYADWNAVLMDDAIRSTGTWYCRQMRCNMHMIIKFSDVALTVGGVYTPIQKPLPEVNTDQHKVDSVSHVVNQQYVYVDKPYDQAPAIQRIPTNYFVGN